MIWASRDKLLRGISNSRRELLDTRAMPAALAAATILFLGATTTIVGCSSFPLSSDGSNTNANTNSRPRKNCVLLRHDDSLHRHRGNRNLVMATSAASEISSSSSSTESPQRRRSRSTAADEYFRKWRKIPPPPAMHDNLERMVSSVETTRQENTQQQQQQQQQQKRNGRILVIGDVHGCLEELQGLVRKSIDEHNDGEQFSAIVLVGDLCNKGPSSARVVRLVRETPGWFSVRGNHDDRALAAALGDDEDACCLKPKYRWVNELSDDDVAWMSDLPYTITIPKEMLHESGGSENERDVIIVHAGLDPAVDLEKQDTETMTTLRDMTVDDDNGTDASRAWARVWRGPELVVFGHDARRGVQREENAVGLDSGCVYGRRLTGIILPEGEFVGVDAVREHCPIEKKEGGSLL